MALQSKKRFKRFWEFYRNPDKINDMTKEFDNALSLFQVCPNLPLGTPPNANGTKQLGSMITTGFDIAKVAKDIDVIIERVRHKLSDKLSK